MVDYTKPAYRWFEWAYKNLEWKKIAVHNRRTIIRMRLGVPDACPKCGGPGPCLFSIDGKWPDDDSHYYWSCRACKGKEDHDKNRNPPHIHIRKKEKGPQP